MGNRHARHGLWFECEADWHVTAISDSLLQFSGYTRRDVIGQHFAGLFLTGALAALHRNSFMKSFHHLSPEDAELRRAFLESHLTKIPVCITTPRGARKTFVTMSELDDGRWRAVITPCTDVRLLPGDAAQDLVPPGFRVAPEEPDGDVAIIALDLSTSTEFLIEHGAAAYASLQAALFAEVRRVVEVELFPIVQMHEVLGDSFVLTVNAHWWTHLRVTHLTFFALTVAEYLVSTLDAVCAPVDGAVHVRAGVAWGPVRTGLSGSRFRLFGSCINRATRLENQCPRGCVLAQGVGWDDGSELLLAAHGTAERGVRSLKGFQGPQSVRLRPVSDTPAVLLQRAVGLVCQQDVFL